MRALAAAVARACTAALRASNGGLESLGRSGGGTRRRKRIVVGESRWQRRDMSSTSPPDSSQQLQPIKKSRADLATSRGLLDTARVLITEDGRPRVVGRWDWHAWQLFVACLPAGAVLFLARSVRREREDELRRAEATTTTPPSSPAAAVSADNKSRSRSSEDLVASLAERVAALEAALAATAAVAASRSGKGGGRGTRGDDDEAVAASASGTIGKEETKLRPSSLSSSSSVSSYLSKSVSWVRDRWRERGGGEGG